MLTGFSSLLLLMHFKQCSMVAIGKKMHNIEIPNIRWDVFELMMSCRYIYWGSVSFDMDAAHDLLRAADQYLLDGLKRLCECAIAKDISVENVCLMYKLSEAFNALSLRYACIHLILEKFDELRWYPQLITHILP